MSGTQELLSGLISYLEQYMNATDSLADSNKNVAETGEAFAKTAERAYRSTSYFVSAGKNLSDFMTKSQTDINKVVSGLEDFNKGIQNSILGNLASSIPIVGSAVDAFKFLAESTAKFAAGYSKVVSDMDSLSKPLRDFQAQAFGIGKAFGLSFEESDKFASGIVNLVTKSEEFKDTFISYPELLATAEGFKNLGLSIGEMNQVVDLGQRDMNLLGSALLVAGASGIDTNKVMQNLTSSIMSQGISAQQAVEQFGLFKDSAEKTGLSISDVEEALTSTVNAYSQMGMAAEFAKPALDAFAMSLDKSGLGIKNAKSLSQSLTQSFADMASSYDKAFITMSKGGMDFSGGVFGASIEMQARMMDAEKTGDQSAMAKEMISAMKGTLQSFTGDDIVTVQEARESPELQKTFVMQQKILQDMYNLSGSSATRTLEMLQDLDSAALSGDVDAAGKLEEMIEEEVKGRNETLEIQERIAKNTQNNVMATLLLNDNFRGMAKSTRMMTSELGRGGEAVLEYGGDKAVEGFDALGDQMDLMAKKINPNYEQEGLDPFEVVTGNMIDKTKGFANLTADAFTDAGGKIISAGEAFAQSVSDAGKNFSSYFSGLGYPQNSQQASGPAAQSYTSATATGSGGGVQGKTP
jgi:hypothetical protein